uniref:Crumbs homolog 3b n=2 Tax=Cyprinus carpio TaxID=7962 RepID=A0A9J7XVM6_CYPCA
MLTTGTLPLLNGHTLRTLLHRYSQSVFVFTCVWSIMSSVSASGLCMPVLFLLALALVLFSCVLRKKRQMEGSYQPSSEERKQAKNHGAERPGLALPLPKEERLI